MIKCSNKGVIILKSYSVKQIAEMLETNPETVRRWIRTGKLKAEKTSNKDGNVIFESALKSFLKSAPKYAATAIGSGAVGVVASTAILAALAAGTAIEIKDLKNATVDGDSIQAFIKTEIASRKELIARKRDCIHQLELEITSESNRLETLNRMLEQLKLLKDQKEE